MDAVALITALTGFATTLGNIYLFIQSNQQANDLISSFERQAQSFDASTERMSQIVEGTHRHLESLIKGLLRKI